MRTDPNTEEIMTGVLQAPVQGEDGQSTSLTDCLQQCSNPVTMGSSEPPHFTTEQTSFSSPQTQSFLSETCARPSQP